MERRAPWLAFPGFLRYYALFHVLVFVIQLIRPEIVLMFEFDREKILSGEVWRLATMFFAGSQFMRGSLMMSLLFLYFGVMFVFMVSDGLENAWGSFKTSVFYYTGIVAILGINFVVDGFPGSGLMLYGSAFLAFATLFPRVEILMFLILPVQIRYLGMLTGGLILYSALKHPILLPFYLIGYANYLIWAAIPALRGTARVMEAGRRRKQFNAGKPPASEAFHTCAVCDRTDVTDPHMEFRIGRDGREYCKDHVPE
ncbi:hypothetical protein GCM10023212_32410 [Luteolibacter yonseiensis]